MIARQGADEKSQLEEWKNNLLQNLTKEIAQIHKAHNNAMEGQREEMERQRDKNRCWTALRYTKPLQFKTTPTLKDNDGNTATSMKAKEALVRKTAFPPPPTSCIQQAIIPPGQAHVQITTEEVGYALNTQSSAKAPGPDKLNFGILRIFWQWDSQRITSIIQHAIRLGYHPDKWKKARGVLLEKGGNRDFTLVKSYRVISLWKKL